MSASERLTPTGTITVTADLRRVALASVIGTAIEWYDYFLYASAAALVFGQLFFEPAGPGLATILAFLTVGISFLFRPLGAFIAGHLGDRIGRRPVLVMTVIVMGAGTALIGLLPGYAQAGLFGPVLLVVLRIVQGIAVGGEWGGAALLAVEHAPKNRRGLLGSMPQMGAPIGLLLSSGVLALLNIAFPGDAFLVWGWRVAFWLSLALVAVGYWIRRSIEESPVFHELAERKEKVRVPVAKLFRRFTPVIIFAALISAGSSAVGYMTTGGYVQNYATDPAGPIHLDRGPVLWAVTLSAVVWMIASFASGWVSDHLGRRTTYAIGYVAMAGGVLALFPLVNTANIVSLGLGLVLLGAAVGFVNGGALPAWVAELFPASVRFSGASISYALGAIIGGAFAPTIAAAIFEATKSTTGITWYLLGMCALGLAGVLLLRDRSGISLRSSNEAEQSHGQLIWQKKVPLGSFDPVAAPAAGAPSGS